MDWFIQKHGLIDVSEPGLVDVSETWIGLSWNMDCLMFLKDGMVWFFRIGLWIPENLSEKCSEYEIGFHEFPTKCKF